MLKNSLKEYSEIKNIQEIIQPVYQAFSEYPLDKEMSYCPCCISPEEVNNLCSKELHDLNEADFDCYPGKALSTWGGVIDFKHFLPRLLELEIYNQYGLHWLSSKFEFSQFSIWPPSEKEALEFFFYQY